MNLLFFHSIAIAPEKGGIERVTKTIADAFAARGDSVCYLSAKHTWEADCDRARQNFLPDEKSLATPENAEFFANLLKEKAIDCVIFQWADGKRFPFPETEKRLGVPVIAAIHTDPCFYEQRLRDKPFSALKTWLRKRRQAKIYRWNAACCTKTVLLSEKFIPGFLKHFPKKNVPAVCAIPNPAPYENVPIDFSKKKKELLFVGRMEMAVKQPQLLLQIWQKLQNRFQDWSLRMVGGGFDEAKIRALAGTLGLQRVHFEGFQTPARFYRDASIFCMTSAYEGFGMALVEAAAFGCVPVAFDSFSAVHDIIKNGENGAIVPAFDLENYAGTLAKLMADAPHRHALAQNTLALAEKFSPKRIREQWEAVFRHR